LSANIAKLQFLMMILFGGAQRGIVWLPNSSVEDTLGTENSWRDHGWREVLGKERYNRIMRIV